MVSICLPVDTMIFYKEPFGVWGTLAVLVVAYIPFIAMQAEAFFPEKEIWIIDRCEFSQLSVWWLTLHINLYPRW